MIKNFEQTPQISLKEKLTELLKRKAEIEKIINDGPNPKRVSRTDNKDFKYENAKSEYKKLKIEIKNARDIMIDNLILKEDKNGLSGKGSSENEKLEFLLERKNELEKIIDLGPSPKSAKNENLTDNGYNQALTELKEIKKILVSLREAKEQELILEGVEQEKFDEEIKNGLESDEFKKEVENLSEAEKEIEEMAPKDADLDEESTGEKEILPEAIKKEKEIPKEVIEKFEKDFNLSKKDLESIEGFKSLSEGQQRLAAQNLKQASLGRIQEEASENYRQNTAEKNFLGRIWQGISKKYQIAKLEKAKAEEITRGGKNVHQETLQQLVSGLKTYGPDVEIKGDKLEIKFASGFKNLKPEQQKIVDNFNQVANEYSRLPDEWRLKSSSRVEYKRFNKIKQSFEKSKTELLNVAKEIKGDKEACLYLNNVEGNIKINQFLSAHPEVEKQLKNIKDKEVWQRALLNIATERGIYMAGGFLTRTATMSLLGIVGAPIAAGISGGYIANVRAKENLKDREKLARRGVKDISKESLKYSEIEKVNNKTNLLIEKIENPELSSEKKEAYKKSLRLNIDWLEDKLNKGLIDFGQAKNRFARQYNLIQSLGNAKVASYSYALDDKYKKRFNLAINGRDSKAEKAKKEYVWKQTKKGAYTAATFAAVGWLIRDIMSGQGWEIGHRGEPLKKGIVDVKFPSRPEDITLKGDVGANIPKYETPDGFFNIKPEDVKVVGKSMVKEGEIYNSPVQTVNESASLPRQTIPNIPDTAKEMTTQAPEVQAPVEETPKVAVEEVVPPVSEKTIEIPKEAFIHKGEGIEHALIRQLKAHPDEYGYKGDVHDAGAIKDWAGQEAHRLAIRSGYVDKITGEEVRIGTKGINTAAYVIEKNKQGDLVVHEYFKDEHDKFTLTETHEQGTEFEGKGKIENYEYTEKKPVETSAAAESPEVETAAEGKIADFDDIPFSEDGSAPDELIEAFNENGIEIKEVEKVIDFKDGISGREEEQIKFWLDHTDKIQKAEVAETVFKIADSSEKLNYQDVLDNLDLVKDINNPVQQAGLLELFKSPDKNALIRLFEDTGVLKDKRLRQVFSFLRDDGKLVINYNIKHGPDFKIIIDGNGRALIDGPLGWNKSFSSLKELNRILTWPFEALDDMEKAGKIKF
ncbi:MAG: hypothetical protein ABIG60_03515 [Patescibacteria group bacterium]